MENSLPTCTSVCNVVCIHDAPLSYGGLRVTAKHSREAGAEQHTELTGVPIIIGIDIDIWINCRGGQNDPIIDSIDTNTGISIRLIRMHWINTFSIFNFQNESR